MFEVKQEDVIRPYEGVIIVHPDATEEDQKNLFKKNKSIIEGFKGQVNHVDTWGKRRLASHIEKIQKAVYFHTTFSAGPQAVAELERTMRINEKVLRFMHTALDRDVELPRFVEEFKTGLEDSAKREREREAKFQAKKAARAGKRDGKGGKGDKRSDYDEDMEE